MSGLGLSDMAEVELASYSVCSERGCGATWRHRSRITRQKQLVRVRLLDGETHCVLVLVQISCGLR